jgi:CXXC-20-CXXC protein
VIVSIISGMRCPVCGETFQYIDAKNRSFSLQSPLNCPRCDARLQCPEHLRRGSLYIEMFLLLGLVLAISALSLFYTRELAPVVLIFGAALFVYWLKRKLQLKNGYISMVELIE